MIGHIRKIATAIICTAFLAAACDNTPPPRIEGRISNLPDGEVYLRVWEGVMRTIDSTQSVSGNFSFESPDILPDLLFIQFDGHPDFYLPVIVDGGDISIAGNFNYNHDITVTGTASNDILLKYRSAVRNYSVMLDAIDIEVKVYGDSSALKDSLRLNTLLAKRDSVHGLITGLQDSFVSKNPADIISALLVNSSMHDSISLPQIDSAIGRLDPGIPDNAFSRRLQRRREALLNH